MDFLIIVSFVCGAVTNALIYDPWDKVLIQISSPEQIEMVIPEGAARKHIKIEAIPSGDGCA